eukprot:m51a1_g4017 hypothetical protein (284) ;mRNA; r:567600-568972
MARLRRRQALLWCVAAGAALVYLATRTTRAPAQPSAPQGSSLVPNRLSVDGCTHEGSHWFGLPEEVAVVRTALARGAAVAALTSRDRAHGCWDASAGGPDAQGVAQQVRELRRAVPELEGAALYALGASSGGTFASVVARVLPEIRGVVLVVSPGDRDALLSNRRPAGFVFMTGDSQWASMQAVDAAVQSMSEAGIRAARWAAGPKKVTESFFSDRIEGVSPAQSALLHKCLLSFKFAGWASLVPAIDEVLNVADGYHEMTREHFAAAFDWLLTGRDTTAKTN